MTTLKDAQTYIGDIFKPKGNREGAAFTMQEHLKTIRRTQNYLEGFEREEVTGMIGDLERVYEGVLDTGKLLNLQAPQDFRVVGRPTENDQLYTLKPTEGNRLFLADGRDDAFDPTLLTQIKIIGRKARRFFEDEGLMLKPNI